MTPTRTYKIIDHFKAGKMVLSIETDGITAITREVMTLDVLISHLYYSYNQWYTFRLINKKGRLG